MRDRAAARIAQILSAAVAVIDVEWSAGRAGAAAIAGLAAVAGIAVCAAGARSDRCMDHPERGVTAIGRARIGIIRRQLLAGNAGAVQARIAAGAGATVRTNAAVADGGIRAKTAAGIAASGLVALVAGTARDRIATDACPRNASVRLRAQVTVRALGAIGLYWIRAHSVEWIATAGLMTLVERSADDRVPARTQARHATIGLGASVVIVASRAVRECGVRACAAIRIAGACRVTLIERGAHHRRPRHATASLTSVSLGAGIVIVTARAIARCRVRNRAGDLVTDIGGAGIAIVDRRALTQ